MENIIPQNQVHGDPFFSTNEYYNCLQEAASYILKTLNVDKIDIAIVEGSGLTDLSDHLFREAGDSVKLIRFSDIPHCPIPTAIGHKQDLLYAVMQGRTTIIWSGRIHYYEGYRATHQAFQAYVSSFMGCSVFISTNAAGFIDQKMAIGDLALITDHISMINKSYDGSLPFDEHLFNQQGLFSTSQLYDKHMIELTREAFIETGVSLHEGPYCYFSAPNYETPAEIQIMYSLGATTVGASTLPEQIACYMTGMRSVIISSGTCPASGMSTEAIDGEEVLIAGQKCVANIAKVIPKLVSKLDNSFFVKKSHSKLKFTSNPHNNVSLTRISNDQELQILAEKLAKSVRQKTGEAAQITQCYWLMSDQIATNFVQFKREESKEEHSTVFFINLKDTAKLRTRSFEHGQIIVAQNGQGEWWIAIRQPFLEGMLPQEYSMLLKALRLLGINQFNVYVETSSVSDQSLNGHVHHISQFFNKRFYKFTETEGDYSPEQNFPNLNEEGGKTLYISEGNLLPSKTEMSLAHKAHFDFYTVTNLSVLDIAQYLEMKAHVIALAKHNLCNRDEEVAEFRDSRWFAQGSHFSLQQNEGKEIKRREVEIPYSATFDVYHSRDCIYETAAKIKEVFGAVENVAVLERESYETLVHDVIKQGKYQIDKAVRLNLKEYKTENKQIDLVKLTSQADGISVLLISETTTFQSNVPFQTLMLPMRLAILGVDAKNFISCPHIWNLQSAKNQDDLKAGDLFVVKDYASISAQNPGIGPNIDEFGPRFFDISTMFEANLTQIIRDAVEQNQSIKAVYGDVFWVNNSAFVHGNVYNKMAEAFSNDRVTFKGLTKTGVPELMAVMHRQCQSPNPLVSAMVGIVTDSVVRKQVQHDRYSLGVKNLVQVLFDAFNKLKV